MLNKSCNSVTANTREFQANPADRRNLCDKTQFNRELSEILKLDKCEIKSIRGMLSNAIDYDEDNLSDIQAELIASKNQIEVLKRMLAKYQDNSRSKMDINLPYNDIEDLSREELKLQFIENRKMLKETDFKMKMYKENLEYSQELVSEQVKQVLKNHEKELKSIRKYSQKNVSEYSILFEKTPDLEKSIVLNSNSFENKNTLLTSDSNEESELTEALVLNKNMNDILNKRVNSNEALVSKYMTNPKEMSENPKARNLERLVKDTFIQSENEPLFN